MTRLAPSKGVRQQHQVSPADGDQSPFDVDPKNPTKWFFTYAACAIVMSLLDCADVR